MKKRELGFGHMGRGILVWDRLHQVNGDYERIAFIDPNRKVKFYVKLSQEDQSEINMFAREEDPKCSTSQDQLVFIERPNSETS